MFKTRLFSGAILVVILAAFLVLGGDVLLVGLTLVSMIGLYEWLRMLKCEKSALAWVGYIGTVLHYVFTRFNVFKVFALEVQWVLLMAFLMIIMLTVYVFKFPKYKPTDIFGVLFGFVYVSIFLSYVYRTRMLTFGSWLVWLIFIVSWGCDTSAYCVGMLFGKHKMAPQLSPKKSIEGAIGGIVGTMLLTGLYLFLITKFTAFEFERTAILVLLSGVAAFVSMIGDLAASAFKRQCDCKDYGTLIPGHGGILDRFDSVIFVSPIVFYFLAFL